MKKIFFLIIFLGIFLGIFLPFNFSKTPAALESDNKQDESIAVVKEAPGIPVRIIISKLNVDTNIESVGLDNQGKMDIPSNDNNTAWYKLGPRPGAIGSSVIDGHYDTISGAPSVFYNLSSLQNGDKIEIIDDKNKTYIFSVTGERYFNYNEFPIEEVFNQNDKERLNLITCGGTWDNVNNNYSLRFVTFSELEK